MRLTVSLFLLVLPIATSAQPSAREHLPKPFEGPLALAPGHPRLVFRPQSGRTFESVRKLYDKDATFRSIFDKAIALEVRDQHPAMLAACWIVTEDEKYAEAAVQALLSGDIRRSGGGGYSNIWSYALAYDWLYGHLRFSAEQRAQVEKKIGERLETELTGLDETGMALWHGRNQAANNAMVGALAIGDLPGQERNLRRAAAHYTNTLRALEFSEGWPEGASYWIYNRAGPYAVTADCVITALQTDRIGGISIREVMRKIGYWSIYQFTPGGFFEPYGDSAGSLRLGETGWWELTTDYFARLSRDPGVMAGADYLRNRSPAPYGKRPYQWYVALSYDPSVRPGGGYDPRRPERWMRRHLPQAMLFGRDSLGVAFFRGAWGDPDELYATFKAGDLLAHHDHYDTGHFSIQRGGLLAPQTGLYGPGGGYFGRHRLGYAIQTVSSNSLLILAPGETSLALRSRKEPAWTALSGGQRVIRPTGFDCASLDHFQELRNSGPHLERAEITAFESAAGKYDYLAADITAAYNSTRWAEPGSVPKVSLVTRQFVYLRPEQAFIVYDRVETTDAAYTPKFLLHTLSKPGSEGEKLVTGKGPENGILEATGNRFVTAHKRGVLTHIPLLPEGGRTLKIGGPDFNCYVEEDGDQSDGLDGLHLEGGDPHQERETAQLGLWRTEIEPAPSTSTRFLNVMVPRLRDESWRLPMVEALPVSEGAHAVLVGQTVVVFASAAAPLGDVSLVLGARVKCLLMDARPRASYRAGNRTLTATGEGVLGCELPAGRSRIRLR